MGGGAQHRLQLGAAVIVHRRGVAAGVLIPHADIHRFVALRDLQGVGFQYHRHILIVLRHITLHLGHGDQQIFLGQADGCIYRRKGDGTICLKFCHGLVAIQRRQGFLDSF